MTLAAPDVPTFRPGTGTAILWIVTAAVSWTVSFLLYREYVGQLSDAPPMLSCNISPFITCGPNLLAPAGNMLGFTNAILGMTLFLGPIFASVGALASPGGMRAWYWRVFAGFVLGGYVLVHVFAYRSIFEFGSLCPWCLIVWLMMIPLFWSVAGWTLQSGVWGAGARRIGALIVSWLVLIVVVDYIVIAAAAQVQLDLLSILF
jgi:uncharacterized membrane protein